MRLCRIEHLDESNGMWTTKIDGKLVLEQLSDDRLLNLPMPYDPIHQTDGKNWKTAVADKAGLLSWFSVKDIEEMVDKGFGILQFTCPSIIEMEHQIIYVDAERRDVINITDMLLKELRDDS